MDKYGRLFEINRYVDDEEIHFYKGLNDSVVDEPHMLPESICERIIHIGQAYKLHYVPLFDIYGDVKFNKTQVRSLIDEFNFIISVVNDEVIKFFVAPLIKLLEEISHSHKDYFLFVLGN